VRDPLPADRVDGRRAALTIAMVVAAVAALALARPRLAGTIGVLVAIIAMIMLHELGHFVMAKRAGMKVTEFFLGFGPRLWSFRRGETEYGVKAIPAGGYVRIIGMSNVEDIDPADEERTYRAKPYRHRLGVAVAGSAMHFIIASVLLFLVYAAAGLPTARPVVDHIEPGFPAAASDFRLGDRIVAINGQKVDEWEDVPIYVQSHGEDQLVFTVERQGAGTLDIALTPRMETVGKRQVPKVGIGPQVFLERESPPVAIGRTIGDMPRFTWATIKALGGIFSPSGVENYTDLLTGRGGDNSGRLLSPYGAARVASQAVESGWAAVLMFLFAINVFVGVFNMVPLLPLDGGHVAIATYEKIASMVTKRRVQVDVARLMPITAAVLLVLVVLGISALYLDIVNPVEGP
jgi:membrane-associated protease RseP (regulator of RpoE activity)